jgi:hypothetical protein
MLTLKSLEFAIARRAFGNVLASRMIDWELVLCYSADDGITRATYPVGVWICMQEQLLNRVKRLIICHLLQAIMAY